MLWIGYGVMAAISLLTVLAAMMPRARSRDPLLGAVLLAGWWLYVARSRSRLRLAEEAAFDPLTGLYTRRHLTTRLEEEIARAARYGGTFALAILDLDDFKALNDERGHLHGDEALRAFGDAVRAMLRQSDLAFRYGGDECLVLFSGTPAAAAEGVLERLRQNLLQVPFSGGIAEYPADGAGPSALLGIADARLLETKRAGKGRVGAGGV